MSNAAPIGYALRRFTLVEMLTVIAIVSLLLAILLPAVARSRNKAHEVSCVNNLRQTMIAYRSYVDDFRGWGPRIYASDGVDTEVTWGEVLFENNYQKTRRSFSCPQMYDLGASRSWYQIYGIPASYPIRSVTGDGWLGNRVDTKMPARVHIPFDQLLQFKPRADLAIAPTPSNTDFMMCSVRWADFLGPRNRGARDMSCVVKKTASADRKDDGTAALVHEGKINVAFMGGNVGAIDRATLGNAKQLWAPILSSIDILKDDKIVTLEPVPLP